MRNVINPIPNLSDNIFIDSDTYKDYHSSMYIPGLDLLYSYFHSRGGRFQEATLFGLQYILHRYWSKPMTMGDVSEAEDFNRTHLIRFDRKMYERIVKKHGGYLPIRLRAIPEGLCLPVQNALLTAESTDPEIPSIESFMETSLVRLWQPSTVAMASKEVKKLLLKYLEITSENPKEDVEYMFCDFGSRGVGTKEQARLSGAAHLLNFGTSDNKEGIRCANHYYYGDNPFVVPGVAASEHSTVCSWGRNREFDMVENAIDIYLTQNIVPGSLKILSCVGDTYNIFEFTNKVTTGKILDKIKKSGGKFVQRLDSGDPLKIIPEVFNLCYLNLSSDIRVNSKGFKKLPNYFGFLQGDGISLDTLEPILKMLVENKICISNFVFGSGGGLHQIWNRDTQKWGFKASAARANGVFIDDVRKDPITDPGKKSRAGRLDTILTSSGEYKTIELENNTIAHPQSIMNTVYENGDILYHNSIYDCIKRMSI